MWTLQPSKPKPKAQAVPKYFFPSQTSSAALHLQAAKALGASLDHYEKVMYSYKIRSVCYILLPILSFTNLLNEKQKALCICDWDSFNISVHEYDWMNGLSRVVGPTVPLKQGVLNDYKANVISYCLDWVVHRCECAAWRHDVHDMTSLMWEIHDLRQYFWFFF